MMKSIHKWFFFFSPCICATSIWTELNKLLTIGHPLRFVAGLTQGNREKHFMNTTCLNFLKSKYLSTNHAIAAVVWIEPVTIETNIDAAIFERFSFFCKAYCLLDIVPIIPVYN